LILWRVFGERFSELVLKFVYGTFAFVIFLIMWRRNLMVRRFIKTVKVKSGEWYNLRKREVVEWHIFDTPNDLLKENDHNDWSERDFWLSPEATVKILLLVLFFATLAIVLLK
jgi:hypothetical protein